MLDGVTVFTQSAIKIDRNKKIYFDPFKIEENFHDADYIFITHDHYDHFDSDSIFKVRNDNTKIIVPNLLKSRVESLGFSKENILDVVPSNSYKIDNLSFSTVAAYNIDKPFHTPDSGWVGYIVNVDNILYYISGDTDFLEENANIKCDVAFVCIGGVYTMNYREAADFVNTIKPKIVVPTHYGSIVGRITDGASFEKLLDDSIECYRLLEHEVM